MDIVRINNKTTSVVYESASLGKKAVPLPCERMFRFSNGRQDCRLAKQRAVCKGPTCIYLPNQCLKL